MSRITAFSIGLAMLLTACAGAGSTPPDALEPGSTPTTSAAGQPPAAATAVPTQPPQPRGTIVASVYRHDHWDIYAVSPEGELLRRYTFGEGDNRAPAWSPDGTLIAFESNRDQNWDLYVINADGSGLRRLTTSPRFDGSPRWSPDGKHIAFTSDRDGDLDIWVADADGANAHNLTPKSPAQDYDPTWSPDGQQIAFTSLRDGNKEIYAMRADGTNVRNLTQSRNSDEDQPAWSPDGRHIAFVSEHDGAREINVLDVDAPQNWKRITRFDVDQWPVWQGSGRLLYVSESEDEQSLYATGVEQNGPVLLSFDHLRYAHPDWSSPAIVPRDETRLARSDEPLYVEKVTPNPPWRPDRYNFVPLVNVRVIVPMLSDAVDDSFTALRRRVLSEAGWDFLGSLSEAARPLTFKSNASDYLSWHKAGRAVDLEQDVITSRGRMMEVAREDVLDEIYWRVYLKTARQDGSQGEPLREVLWDVSETTRARLPGRGGVPKGVPFGYYVDFTELARQYGWQRISSHTEPSFDWRRDFSALEYWHYQKTDGLSWWQAMQQIYRPEDIADLFSYANLTKQKYDLLTMIEKGIPLPVDVLNRYSSLQP